MTRLSRVWPYLLFAAITLAIFWKFLLFNETIYPLEDIEAHLGRPVTESRGWFRPDTPHAIVGDGVFLLPANLRVYNEGLKSGELRLWNPYLFCGFPIYADPVVHPFYPPHLALHFLLSPDAAYETSLMLHLFFSGAAMFWLLRAFKRSTHAAAAGGVVWMLFGYNATWFSSMIFLGAAVFAPLTLFFLIRGLERRSLHDAAAAGLSMGMTILGSHPQHAVHLFLFFLAWLAFAAAREREGRSFVARFATYFVTLSVGVGLAAILTRLDTISNGYRNPGGDFDRFYSEPFALLSHLLGLVVGKVYFPKAQFAESEFCVFAGLGAATLAAAGALRNFRDPRVRFATIAGGIALLLAFVQPLAKAIQFVPILNMSPPSRFIFVAGFCLSLLAGFGLDSLGERIGRAWVVLAAITAAFLAACVARIGPARLSNAAAIETLIGFALAAGATVAARRSARTGLVLAFATLLFELAPFFLIFNRHVDGAALKERPPAVRFALERETEPWRGTGALGNVGSADGQAAPAELTIGNNLLAHFGVENLAGYEGIIPIHYLRFCAEAGGQIDPVGRVVRFLHFDSRLLDAAGLTYLFVPFKLRPPARFRPVAGFDNPKLYENSEALPRARLVSRVLAASDEEAAVRILRSPIFNAHDTVILETSSPPLCSTASLPHRVIWKSRTSDRIVLEVSTPRSGVLVLADSDYPGWEATVDGKTTTLYRANVAFRAVEVPAGTHEVVFRFRPESARYGLIATVGFLALGLGFIAAPLKGRASAPQVPSR